MIKIFKGNLYDSRTPGHSYSMWTSGYDVRIEEENGVAYGYQMRCFDDPVVTVIEVPTEMEEEVEISWEDLSKTIKKLHFRKVHPQGTEDELNIYLFGEEKGRKLNEDIAWAKAKGAGFFSVEDTLQIMKEIGRFEEIEFVCRRKGKYHGTEIIIYIIDGKWQVTFWQNDLIIEDYAEVLAQKRAFGRRVKKLAKAAGVPWEIAKLVGNVSSDEEAISILEQIKTAREKLPDLPRKKDWEFRQILGDEVWWKLNRGGRKKLYLANYLSKGAI